MYKSLIIASLIGSFTILAMTVELVEAAFMLLLFGKIPGTALLIPPVIMLSLWGVFVLTLLASVFALSFDSRNIKQLSSPAAKRRPTA